MQTRLSPSNAAARSALRDHTRDAHERLHELAIFRALLTGSLAHAGYRHLLERLHAYYQRVDEVLAQACARFAAHELHYRYAARAPLLARDVAALGGVSDADHGAAQVMPEIDSAAALAGALYVIEGSLLGGATLDRAARRLLAHAHDGGSDGRCYWAWCQEVGASRWQRTATLIDDWLDTPAGLQQASGTARATFERLHGWLAPLAAVPC